MPEPEKTPNKVEIITLPPASAESFDLRHAKPPQTSDPLKPLPPKPFTESERMKEAMKPLPACGVKHDELPCNNTTIKVQRDLPDGTTIKVGKDLKFIKHF